MAVQVHWHEGLFLQPHHFQRMQKSVTDMVADERRFSWPFWHGLLDLHISEDELKVFRVTVDRLRLLTESGLLLELSDDVDRSNVQISSLDIRQAFARSGDGFTVLLGVPKWFKDRPNTMDPASSELNRAKLLYRVAETKCTDENTGQNAKDLQVRKYNARLLFEGDDAVDMETIPLLRIVRMPGRESSLPQVDQHFVPPCFLLSGSRKLWALARDLVSTIQATRQEMVVRLTSAGFSTKTLTGTDFELMMRLHILNRYSARLPSLLAVSEAGRGVTPFEMYLEFRELLAELVALQPDRDNLFNVPEYAHDNPYIAFAELDRNIRAFLQRTVKEKFIKADFLMENGYLRVRLTEEHLKAPNAYFLGIKGKVNPGQLTGFVEDGWKFKLMPSSMGASAVLGVPLKDERPPPPELPAQGDLFYYRLDVSSRRWQQLAAEKEGILDWGKADAAAAGLANLTEAKFGLYMTIP